MSVDARAFEQAVALHRAGRLAEAESLYRQILAIEPAHSDALNLLGVIAHQMGQHETAVSLVRRAIAVNPNVADYHNHAGLALSELGRLDEAIAAYRDALRLDPALAEGWNNLGNLLSERRDDDEAVAAFRRAIALVPGYAAAHYNLGVAFLAQGRAGEAIGAFREAIRLKPEQVEFHSNLASALIEHAQLDEAIEACERALRLDPNYAKAHNNLGCALREQGRIGEAIAAFQRAIEIEPGGEWHSNYLLSLHYLPGVEREFVLDEHRKWDRIHAAPLARDIRPHDNDRSVERRLRVGYVSADFRDHVVGRTLLPCFEAHDRTGFDFVCYSGTSPSDAIGKRFRQLATEWCETARLTDEEFAARIRADRIDILVDLALHTAGNRLAVFARKPAPVQVSWLGYPDTSGLGTMDYRITDARLEPEHGDPGALRLPDCWSLYGAPADGPEPGELPAARNGFVTFGCFNSFAKINAPVLELWAAILNAVPDSRLLLLAKESRHERALAHFEQRGIAPGRVKFLAYQPPGRTSAAAYLARYQQVDVALDPFPYNGMTTTCDALWMGVPVVALVGDLPLARASFSLLSNVGLAELAGGSEAAYVEIATSLAKDLPRLASLRATLRERMRNSPLLDAARFARHLEAAWRTIWRRWCNS